MMCPICSTEMHVFFLHLAHHGLLYLVFFIIRIFRKICEHVAVSLGVDSGVFCPLQSSLSGALGSPPPAVSAGSLALTSSHVRLACLAWLALAISIFWKRAHRPPWFCERLFSALLLSSLSLGVNHCFIGV